MMYKVMNILYKKGKAIYIAPLNQHTLAAVKPWGIRRELVV
jgi:hypothetical protein